MPSVTEIYLNKNKFRNEEKLKILKAMNSSYVGLFKVIDVDRNDGYVTYKDVFTKKTFKIIDVAMSSTLTIDPKKPVYIYNRIITIDGISFGTGIHCMMTWKNEYLKKFINTHKYYKCSNFSRCIMIYEISKKEENLVVHYNNVYKNRR